jgi:hypothetical protein
MRRQSTRTSASPILALPKTEPACGLGNIQPQPLVEHKDQPGYAAVPGEEDFQRTVTSG